ncbi:MAG: hypothetical protein KF696_15045 [Planctomycetes bacterium]|nr:hypothetical protein [Planctomycetota bacterium]MCW8135884.1 hypothetical protein [Planctomycetota bacterium]
MRMMFPVAVALLFGALTVSPTAAQPAFKDGGNTWAQSKVGDYVQYQLAAGLTVTYEVMAIAEDGTLTIEIANFSAEGTELSRRQIQRTPDKAPVQAKPPAAGMPAKWTTAEYEMAELKLPCDVVSFAGAEANGETWFSTQVPCGGVVKSATDGQDTVWLVGFTRDGVSHALKSIEPEPEPEPEPAPEPAGIEGYGDPIAQQIPARVRKQMQDQGTAITRLRLYFQDEKGKDDGVSLEFEGMYTEVPVIYAAFDPDRSDKSLTYKQWSDRNGHFVDLGFDVKTRPAQLANMQVKIEHSHLQGDLETALATYPVSAPEPGDRWETCRLRGARPGINRYTLLVIYTDSKGQRTEQRGFSHWVLVAAPPMFQFRMSAQAHATRRTAKGITLLDAEVSLQAVFNLHGGLDPRECTLRMSRRGSRNADLSRLPADVRRAAARDAAPTGWQELGRCALGDTVGGVLVSEMDGGTVLVRFTHSFAASSNVLPVSDEWEYRFELMQRANPKPLAVWSAHVSLRISKPEDIAAARMKVDATGLEQPLSVPFEQSGDRG